MSDPGTPARTRSGSCLCGQVAFSVTGEPDDPHICWCVHCSTRAGSPFMWWVGFPAATLSWTGESQLTWFDTIPGVTARGFCRACGTHLAARDHAGTATVGIVVTALKDFSDPALVPTNLYRLPLAAAWLGLAGTQAAD